MSQGVKIQGHSDDIINLEGFGGCKIYDEVGHYSEKPVYISFSDGTQIKANFDSDGIWRLERTREGHADYHREAGSVVHDTNDVVTLTYNYLEWFTAWKNPEPTDGELREWLDNWMQDHNASDLNGKQVLAVCETIMGHPL